MGIRSQAHMLRTGRYTSGGVSPRPPAITGILPDSVMGAAAGAVNRVIATLSASGGTAPFTWSIVAAGGLSVTIAGNTLRTSADPCGTVGLHTATIRATDSWGQAKDEPIDVTLT